MDEQIVRQAAEAIATVEVLFDHNVPHKLRRSLPGHEVTTTEERGLGRTENGEPPNVAEDEAFAVMVKRDKNLSHQQDLAGRNLVLVVLSTDNWNVISPAPQRVAAAVDAALPGSFQVATFDAL